MTPTIALTFIGIYLAMFFVTWIVDQVHWEKNGGYNEAHLFALSHREPGFRWFAFTIWPLAWTVLTATSGLTGVQKAVEGLSRAIASRI